MYKLVAIDLDGTLLNKNGIITNKTKQILNQIIKEKQIQIVLASGRPIDSIKTISKEIGNLQYLIAGNGAAIYDTQKEEIIYQKFLKKQKAIQIAKICEENSIYYNIYTSKEIITNKLKCNVLVYHKENQMKSEKNKTRINIVENVEKYLQEKEEVEILKITVCDENETIFKYILQKLKKIKEIEVLEISHMSRKIIQQGTNEIPINYFYTEITLKDIDKWNAIEFLINKLSIQKEEVIAIGDNLNDKKMIENSGHGMAMKGSTPEITKIANSVTDFDNNHDGAVQKLLEILNN